MERRSQMKDVVSHVSVGESRMVPGVLSSGMAHPRGEAFGGE